MKKLKYKENVSKKIIIRIIFFKGIILLVTGSLWFRNGSSLGSQLFRTQDSATAIYSVSQGSPREVCLFHNMYSINIQNANSTLTTCYYHNIWEFLCSGNVQSVSNRIHGFQVPKDLPGPHVHWKEGTATPPAPRRCQQQLQIKAGKKTG